MGKPRELTVEFNAPQFAAYQAVAPRRTVVTAFGRGVGKSWFQLRVWLLLVALWDGKQREGDKRGVRIIPMMPTLKQFKDIYASLIEDALSGEWNWLGGRYDRATGCLSFPGRSWVKPFPAMEHSSRTARGMRCDVIALDEADDIDPSVHDGVAIPWLSEPWGLGIELLSGTPRRGRHGLLYRSYRDGQTGARLRAGEEIPGVDAKKAEQLRKIFSFHATYRDAPKTVLADAVEYARATTPPQVFKREWECDFDAAEGLVFGDVYDERFHVRQPSPETVWTEILIGADHGWEDPGCLLLIGVLGHGRDAVCWVLHEVYKQHLADSQWVAEMAKLLSWYPNARVYPDPSRPGLIDDFKKLAGARIQPVDNSIEDGIATMADMFLVRKDADGNNARSHLYVSPACQNFIRELGSYRRKRDPRDHDRYLDTIEDRNNHAIDACRYSLHGRFGGPGSGRNQARYDDRS